MRSAHRINLCRAVNRVPVDHEWHVMKPLLLPPEVYYLLRLGDIQVQVVVFTPWRQPLHLLQIGWLIVIRDQAYHHCVIRVFHNGVGAVHGWTVMSVKGVEQGAQDTAFEGRQCWGYARWRCSDQSSPPAVCLSGSSGPKSILRSLAPGLWAWLLVWWELLC